MNQEKIGKFIATLRKNKNMTQKDLAQQLHISDRTVSKWENGRGLPELSSLQPLCNILDISINELLNGEKIDKVESEKISEEIILNTIEYSEKKIKKSKKVYLLLFLVIFIIFSLFALDLYKMTHNQPVLFSTWGFDYAPPIDLHEDLIEIAIEDYIIEKNDLESKHYYNEKWFASIETYSIEEVEEKTLYHVYAWVLEESFYNNNGEIVKDSGSSIPHKFTVQRNEYSYTVIKSETPRDGSYYSKDIKTLFPYTIRNKFSKIYQDGTIQRLQLAIQKKVKLYFKL